MNYLQILHADDAVDSRCQLSVVTDTACELVHCALLFKHDHHDFQSGSDVLREWLLALKWQQMCKSGPTDHAILQF